MKIGDYVTVTIDRPIGTPHPKHPDIIYPINYGYVEGIMGGDGEWQDVYVLGENKPIESFYGKIIAIVKRFDDVEEKWVVSNDNHQYSKDEINDIIHFQEQFYHIEIKM